MLARMLCRLFVGICHQSYKQPFCRQSVKQWLQILTWQTHTCLFCIFKKSPVFSFCSFFLLKLSNTFKSYFPSIEPQIWIAVIFGTFFLPSIFDIGNKTTISSSLRDNIFLYNTLCHFKFCLMLVMKQH